MGLKVSDFNVDMLKGKEVVSADFNTGSEYILNLMDKDGNFERVRIPAHLANLLENFSDIAVYSR